MGVTDRTDPYIYIDERKVQNIELKIDNVTKI